MEEDIKSILLDLLKDDDLSDNDSDILYSDNELDSFRRSKEIVENNFWEVVVPTFTDTEFLEQFRINRETFNKLAEQYHNSKNYQNLQTGKAHSAAKHLAVFLWFAGRRACSFREISKKFHLSMSTIFSYIRRCTTYLSGLSKNTILWPREHEKQSSEEYFRNQKNFPGVMANIGTTRIKIDAPNYVRKEFCDTKGNLTICLQAVCTADEKFADVFIGLPGSTTDAKTLSISPLYGKLRELCGDYVILGGPNFPSTVNILSQFRDNGYLSISQTNFNQQLNFARQSILNTFSAVKQRFRQLYYCKLKNVEHICHFIRACCVLHNLTDPHDIFILQALDEGVNTDIVQASEEDSMEIENVLPTDETELGNKRRVIIAEQLYRNKVFNI